MRPSDRRDPKREPLASASHEIVDLLGRARRLGGDHDLVGPKDREGVRDRLNGIGVPDVTLDVRRGSLKLSDDCRQPLLGTTSSGVFVREPVPEPGIQCRRNHEDVGARQPRGSDRIDGDDEHVRRASVFPEAGKLAQEGEARRQIGSPGPSIVAEPSHDLLEGRLMGQ